MSVPIIRIIEIMIENIDKRRATWHGNCSFHKHENMRADLRQVKGDPEWLYVCEDCWIKTKEMTRYEY